MNTVAATKSLVMPGNYGDSENHRGLRDAPRAQRCARSDTQNRLKGERAPGSAVEAFEDAGHHVAAVVGGLAQRAEGTGALGDRFHLRAVAQEKPLPGTVGTSEHLTEQVRELVCHRSTITQGRWNPLRVGDRNRHVANDEPKPAG